MPGVRRSTVRNSTKNDSSEAILSFYLYLCLHLCLFIHRSIPLIPGSLTLIENFTTPSLSWDINIHRRAERRLTLHPLGITLIHPHPLSRRPSSFPWFYETVPTHHLSASVAEIVARLLSRCRDLILTDPDTWDKFCFQNQKRVRRLSATAVRRIVTSSFRLGTLSPGRGCVIAPGPPLACVANRLWNLDLRFPDLPRWLIWR